MSTLRALLITSLYFVSAAGAEAQEPNCALRVCPGKAPNPHGDANYQFRTTSRVYKDGRDEMFVTCVENTGSKDMEVNWVIPGPETVVLKGCAVTAPRPHDTRQVLDNHKGCLRYGASWKWTKAPFIPHAADAGSIAGEVGDCRSLYVVDARQVPSQPRDMRIEAERFGSSVYEEFQRTLSRIFYALSIDVNQAENVYTTSIKITISSAYKDQPEYYSKGFEILASEEIGSSEYVASASGNAQGGEFVDGGVIEYTLPIPEKAVQRFLRYRVLSSDDKQVASFDVPIWVPAPNVNP
ncbi:hypothetical protein [Sinorhizobium meliloti]|uniref:hypothetical protein n=1 Tax=Rhizobium meliloti TaxID=382 RepID=UPI000FDA7D95|nr:hypothetical protein [Sinorhizobium meliloti]RVQ04156.1 hypothetical protein CN070_02970 [Sinorhizobium meliloti]